MISKNILQTLLLLLSSSFASPLLGLSESTTQPNDIPSTSKFFKLSAQKFRNSILDKTKFDEASLLKKRDDDDYVELDLSNESTFYLTEVEIGTPVQKVGVLVDTGSSDFWVVASNNTYCQSGTFKKTQISK